MQLKISQDLVLLGMDDKKGTIVVNASPDFNICIASSIFFDLLLSANINYSDGSLTKLSQPEPGHLAAAYAAITDGMTMSQFIKALDKIDIKENTVSSLTERGILSVETKKILFIKKDMFPTDNPDPENKTRFSLHQAVFEGANMDKHCYILLFLIKAGNLIDEVFRKRADEARNKIDAILEKSKSSLLSADEVSAFNDVVSAMQRRMLMPI